MRTFIIICNMLLFMSCQQAQNDKIMHQESERFKIGWKNLQTIDREAGEKVIESLNHISPDLSQYIIEYAFGDVYNRKGLDLKSKEIAVVGALTAMGNARPQLKVHLNAALNVGCSIAEVQEVILQMSAYSGFPSAINGMMAFEEVLDERKSNGTKDKKGMIKSSFIPTGKTRYDVGAERLRELNPNQVEILEDTFQDISPDLVKYIIEYGFADISARPALALRHREIATIAALAANGTASPQLKFHIKAGINVGLSPDEISEIMLLMSVYSGFPAAINGTMALKEVINEN